MRIKFDFLTIFIIVWLLAVLGIVSYMAYKLEGKAGDYISNPLLEGVKAYDLTCTCSSYNAKKSIPTFIISPEGVQTLRTSNQNSLEVFNFSELNLTSID